MTWRSAAVATLRQLGRDSKYRFWLIIDSPA
jgi:hypothetical protein